MTLHLRLTDHDQDAATDDQDMKASDQDGDGTTPKTKINIIKPTMKLQEMKKLSTPTSVRIPGYKSQHSNPH